MLVIWSVVVWALFFARVCKKKRIMAETQAGQIVISRVSPLNVFFCLFLLWFFAGMRTYGADTILYIENFQKLPEEFIFPKLSGSFLFNLFERFTRSFISDSPTVWLLIMDTLAMIPLCKALSRYSIDIRISLFLFFMSGMFEYFFNGSRQMIAMCICFSAIKHLERGNLLNYVLWVIVAALFHSTALVMLACIPLYLCKPWSKILAIPILAVMILCALPNGIMISLIEESIAGSGYSQYIGQLDGEGVNIFRALSIFVPTIICFINRKKIERINNPILNFSVNMSLMTSVLYFCSLFITALVGVRIAVYFQMYLLVLYPLLFKIVIRGNGKMIQRIFYVTYLLLFLYQMYIVYGGFPYVSSVLHIGC